MNDSYLNEIKSIPIEDYAQRQGYTVKALGQRYVTLKEHDSVRIDRYKNCYFQNSTGDAGSIIDFAINMCGVGSAKEAMDEIASSYGIERGKEYVPRYKKHDLMKIRELQQEKGELVLPERAADNEKVRNYLLNVRKITPSVVRYFLKHDMLYQDNRNNCVFKTPKYACLRSTGGKTFKIDTKGCDYSSGFYFKGRADAKRLYVSEGVVDIMSVMSIKDKQKERYTSDAYLALGGVGKAEAIYNHLDKDSNIKEVILCLDNDEAGREASEQIEEKLKADYPNVKVEVQNAPAGKDWNEYLVILAEDEEKSKLSLCKLRKNKGIKER